ncbi:MAG: hypothetical protein AAGA09_05500 [Pseudomonadota bacterium]
MSRFILSLGLAVSVFCTPALAADPFANIKTYDRDAHNRKETLCDQLAGHPNDPEAVARGVSQEEMDKPAAIAACLAAVENDPDNPRLNYQLARAYGYSGLHEEGDPYRTKALEAGYPQSLFVVGYIRIEGWDGREADPCYGGELVRRSAQAGRLAGLVGFPHYVQTGRLDRCGAYPVVRREEIQSFLQNAEGKARTYYQRILIKSLETHFAAEQIDGAR